MIAIIDYDAGNLKSVEKALVYLKEEPVITRDAEVLLQADHVILPGVGAFGDAMRKLEQYGLVDVIQKIAAKGTPLLGICLGLQLLFESSEETPGVDGLGICKGKILRIPDRGLKVPHMGWNSLTYGSGAGKKYVSASDEKSNGGFSAEKPGRLFRGIPENSYVYFVHSYYLAAEDPSIVAASTEYSVNIHASVEQGNVFACQFHPEKSGSTGLAILKNFICIGKEEA